MNVTFMPVRVAPRQAGFRPDPAETIEKGIELGSDPVQQDLFALSAGVSDVKSAADFVEVGKSKGQDSWQKGAYSVAASLSGTPAAGAGLVQTVEGLFSDPTSRGYFAVAGGLAGSEEMVRLKDITTGFGANPTENGVLGVAAAIAGAAPPERPSMPAWERARTPVRAHCSLWLRLWPEVPTSWARR